MIGHAGRTWARRYVGAFRPDGASTMMATAACRGRRSRMKEEVRFGPRPGSLSPPVNGA